MVKRTPSTSAIYETLRRSKELRESLSRPSSRLSIDNIPDKLKEPVSNLIRILAITPFNDTRAVVLKFTCQLLQTKMSV